jgi:hypothetical protein
MKNTNESKIFTGQRFGKFFDIVHITMSELLRHYDGEKGKFEEEYKNWRRMTFGTKDIRVKEVLRKSIGMFNENKNGQILNKIQKINFN